MKAKDPICGMSVETETSKIHGTYDGVEVYFCAELCRRKFEARRAPR
jgi:YHS domain-containing protein